MSKTRIHVPEKEVIEFRTEIQERLRRRVQEAIHLVLEEELTEALGCPRYERDGERRGYRNGRERRTITTAVGARELEVPRGRIFEEGGSSREFRSRLLPRYARRTREVDDAILSCYLAGANSRKIRKALSPLLGKHNLSKSAVSRVVGRLKVHFQRWCERDLSEEPYLILFLDAIHLKVRMARKVVSVPVLAVLGVRQDGSKALVALRLAMSEAEVHWRGLIDDLKERGLPAPFLVVSDGHAGLNKALQAWPDARVQRCTRHKWCNLRDHCPVHAREELKKDWNAIVEAEDGEKARRAYRRMVVKWSKLVPAVARSLEEAGLQLLTFYEFPKELWRSLRTTNTLENLNREFRRRTKTQGAYTNETAALTLLWGLLAFGHLRMRRINGGDHLSSVLRDQETVAA